MKIVDIKIDELVPYENNPRFNDDAVDAVAKSIQEFGFKVPCVIDGNNNVITGHTRIKACKQLGMEEVPCVIADDLTEAQQRSFRLVDNRTAELSDWDFTEEADIVYDGFLGSGSTLIACEKTNRICYGMELSPIYIDVIIDRWENFTGETAVKL